MLANIGATVGIEGTCPNKYWSEFDAAFDVGLDSRCGPLAEPDTDEKWVALWLSRKDDHSD